MVMMAFCEFSMERPWKAMIMQFSHDYDHGFPWTFHRKFMESHGDYGFL